MSKINRITCVLCFLFALIGCSENHASYSYLVGHYDYLKKEVDKCTTTANQTQMQNNYCENVVLKAANNFNSLLEEQRSDPEAFGEKIMDAQNATITANQEYRQAKQTLALLKSKKAPGTEIKTAQEKLITAKQTSDAKQDEVRLMMTIMGLNSPE